MGLFKFVANLIDGKDKEKKKKETSLKKDKETAKEEVVQPSAVSTENVSAVEETSVAVDKTSVVSEMTTAPVEEPSTPPVVEPAPASVEEPSTPSVVEPAPATIEKTVAAPVVEQATPPVKSSAKKDIEENKAMAVQELPSVKVLSASNCIEAEDEIVSSILDKIASTFRGKKMNFGNMDLVVWVADNLLYVNIGNVNFKNKLITELSVQKGYVFNSVDVKYLSSLNDITYTPIFSNLFIEVKEVGRVVLKHRARISVYMEQGELLEKEYILESFTLEQSREKVYNIGSGKYVRTDSGLMRENHIVVNNDPNSPAFELNKYVSRSHAHIGFLDKYGFCLYVDPKGTRLANKRTRILRGADQQIEMNNPVLPEPLKNGDIIELSKHVLLLFEVL